MEHWLLFHIYEAFFAEHQHPLIYTTEYDRGGFDIAIGVNAHIREFQLKVVAKNAKTRSWEVHRSLIRPTIDHLGPYGFLAEGFAAGREGGVILMVVDARPSRIEQVQLHYCDINTLAYRFISGRSDETPNGPILTGLQRDPFESKPLKLRRTHFLHMHSVATLLEFAGFPIGSGRRHNIPHAVLTTAKRCFAPNPGEGYLPPGETSAAHLTRMIDPLLARGSAS